MAKPHDRRRSSGRTNLASCAVATVFLLILLVVLLVVYFTVFKPKDPKISVNAVQLPSFAVSNNTANFSFSQYVAVRNPNRAAFSHYNNVIQLFYYGNRIGYTFVPAGEIESGRTKRMLATFSVQSFPLAAASSSQISAAQFQNSDRSGSTVEIESKLEMAGRVRVLGLFTHRIAAKCNCRIAISSSDGSIVAVRC